MKSPTINPSGRNADGIFVNGSNKEIRWEHKNQYGVEVMNQDGLREWMIANKNVKITHIRNTKRGAW